GLDLDEDDEAPVQARSASKRASSAASKAADAAPTKPVTKASGTIDIPGGKPKRDIARYVVYGVLGLAVLVVGGGYVAMEMGLLEPEPPPPHAQQNKPNDETPTPTPSTDEPTERSEELLARLDLDTPAAYVQVLTLAADAGDAVAEAEAALLLHFRFGPDPERLARAGQLLAGREGATQPFVRRVIGLGLLAADRHEDALAYFDAEEPRSQLYRAWALLGLERVEEARKAAEAVTAVRANDRGAQLAVLHARFAANPIDGIAAMRQAAAAASNHLALHEALMNAVHSQGRLGEAASIGRKLDLGAASAAHKAEILRRRAGVAAAQGQLGEAMRLLEQALESDPSSLAAKLARIELWLHNRDFVTLRTEVDVLTREHPTDPEVLKLAARVDLEAGRADDARTWLTQLGELASTDPEVHDILGQAHAYANEVAQARAAFAESRKLDPLYWWATVHEADLLVRDLQPDAALKLLTEQQAALTEQDAKSSSRGRRALAALARHRAVVHRGSGQLEQALTAAEEAIATDASDNDALLLRAQLLGELGQRSAHEEALTELHERTGGYPGLTEPLGKVLLRKNKLAELEALIGEQLDSEDASREILLTGAALRLAQEQAEQARKLAQRVLDRDPTDGRAHLLLGRAMLLEGEYARALDEIQSAQTREGDPEVELWLGQALEYNARADEARGHYTRALELDPHNLEAAALLGRLFAYEGASRKAIELLQPVVDATNDYPYAWLAIGLAQRDLNQRVAAVASFQKAQQFDPSLFEAYYQEGRIHNDQNQHSAAVKALQAGVDKALENAQEHQLLDAWRRLGESYYELGRRSEAKTALEEYLKLAPASAAGRREVERLLRDL
ncbi:MAG TPA: tetratricopeptide repeat protein, partial [Enhygromyxa sp.]|nr:tetratricopeptide repeat protein [Enhygromyxa sp.]